MENRACLDKVELLNALADGELRGKEKVSLQQHLLRCRGCRDYEQALLGLKARVKSACLQVLFPSSLRHRVVGRIAQQPSALSLSPHWQALRWLWLSAALTVLAASVVVAAFQVVPVRRPVEIDPLALIGIYYHHKSHPLEAFDYQYQYQSQPVTNRQSKGERDEFFANPCAMDSYVMGGRHVERGLDRARGYRLRRTGACDCLAKRRIMVLWYEKEGAPDRAAVVFQFPSNEFRLIDIELTSLPWESRIYYHGEKYKRTLVTWQHGGNTFVMVGRAPWYELVRLASSLFPAY